MLWIIGGAIVLGASAILICACVAGAQRDAEERRWHECGNHSDPYLPLGFPRSPRAGSAAGASAKVPGGVDISSPHGRKI